MSAQMKDEWRYQRSGYGSRNADFDIVSVATGGRIASTPYANKAALIVRAVNEHEALLAVAEAAKDYSTAIGQRELATMQNFPAERRG